MAETQVEIPIRFAEHLVYWAMGRQCELTEKGGRGRCPRRAAAIKWEDHFADVVCEQHAQTAEERGALVVRPRRADGMP